MNDIELFNADCLDIMKTLPDKSIDLILCDLPYGTTANYWDSIIPYDQLWEQYSRLCTGAIVLTATQPFSSALVMSNPTKFKHEWIWRKNKVVGILNAKYRPLQQHEVVLVFAYNKITYNPQGVYKCSKTAKGTTSANYGLAAATYEQTQTGYPRSVLDIDSAQNTVHPTQKPVELMEYMIKTYSNEGDRVLDNCMGSGTTGVACAATKRKFVGIERDPKFFAIATDRINSAKEKTDTFSTLFAEE